MMGVIREAFEAGADIAKLAVMPHTFEDVLRLLEVTLHSKYADTPTAPGQLRVDELKYMLKIL